jgi:hypothetical protein
VDLQAHGPAALKLYCHEVTVRFVERAVVPPYEGSIPGCDSWHGAPLDRHRLRVNFGEFAFHALG